MDRQWERQTPPLVGSAVQWGLNYRSRRWKDPHRRDYVTIGARDLPLPALQREGRRRQRETMHCLLAHVVCEVFRRQDSRAKRRD